MNSSVSGWKKKLNTARRFVTYDVWQDDSFDRKSRATLLTWARVTILSAQGAIRNKIPHQAAALSYYTLIALGPLLALTIMVSGFVLDGKDEDFAADTLNSLIRFVAPQVGLEADVFDSHDHELTDTGDLNPQLVALIDNLVDKARSGAVGVVGSIILIAISIQLLASIENTFNQIWGVRRGRTIFSRVVTYWTVISLGAVLGFAALTLLAGSAAHQFFDSVSIGFGDDGHSLSKWVGPLLSFAVIASLLTFFYRFIPNTTVNWRAALAGSIMVTGLLILNNYLSFLYIDRVIRAQSLYGSIAIIPVLLFGLYIFWLFVLAGGQLSYSLQNASLLSRSRLWENMSLTSRETLCLAVFVLIARRFQQCGKPLSVIELSEKLHVPSHILNQSLTVLCDMHYLAPVDEENPAAENATRYVPSRPLEKVSLQQFKYDFESHGNSEGVRSIATTDPILIHFQQLHPSPAESSAQQQSLASLIESHPETHTELGSVNGE